jgi:hypothetical protein
MVATEYMWKDVVLGLGRPRVGCPQLGSMTIKLVTQHLGRFWMSTCFEDSC